MNQWDVNTDAAVHVKVAEEHVLMPVLAVAVYADNLVHQDVLKVATNTISHIEQIPICSIEINE